MHHDDGHIPLPRTGHICWCFAILAGLAPHREQKRANRGIFRARALVSNLTLAEEVSYCCKNATLQEFLITGFVIEIWRACRQARRSTFCGDANAMYGPSDELPMRMLESASSGCFGRICHGTDRAVGNRVGGSVNGVCRVPRMHGPQTQSATGYLACGRPWLFGVNYRCPGRTQGSLDDERLYAQGRRGVACSG